MTNVKWLIALDMANVLMGNVFVPEDTLDQHASKVSNRKKLYIPSTLKIDRILWRTQLIVCAVKC